MSRLLRFYFPLRILLLFSPALPAAHQTPDTATSPLKEFHAEGMRTFTEATVAAVAAIPPGSQISRKDMQVAADRLMQSGLFAKVSYTFRDQGGGVSVTYHVQESSRIPAYFDNFPWFSDGELADAIRKKLVFYDGTLPEAGDVLDQADATLNDLLASRNLQVTVEHKILPNPFGDGNVQEFQIQGAALKIAKIDFSDPSVALSLAVQQHVSDLLGKPYSRLTIDLFLSEHVRPFFFEKGFLRAKLGPPEVHLSGNPNQKLPEEIPVFIPITPGAVYRWKAVEWSGNFVISSITLTSSIGLKPGDVANGMAIEAAWDAAREEYGHRGYLEAKVDPSPAYDDQAHTISYSVKINEGQVYKFGTMVLTGISPTAERRLRAAWPIPAGTTFDKALYEDFLTKLEVHPEKVFGDLPLHYENVGHWLKTTPELAVADVLLDFK